MDLKKKKKNCSDWLFFDNFDLALVLKVTTYTEFEMKTWLHVNVFICGHGIVLTVYVASALYNSTK